MLQQAEKDGSSEFMVSVWQAGEGLPVNIIEDLEESPDGFLWCGTRQGLARFDGLRFQCFFTIPTGPRYGARVGPLELDGRGRLWVVPDQVGLACQEDHGFRDILTRDFVLRDRLEDLSSDGKSYLYWVDASGRLGRISTEEPNRAELIPAVGARGARWLCGSDGHLWLIRPRGISLYRDGQWHEFEPSGGATLVAALRRESGLWVALQGKLHSLGTNGVLKQEALFPWLGAGTRVTCMAEDSARRLWIGTASQGLYCFQHGRFRQVLPVASSILCLLHDRHGNTWVGTRGGGLIRMRQRYFFVQDLRAGLKNDFVQSLAQDRAGRVWLASSEGGLGWWQNGVWRELTAADGWPGSESRSVCPSAEGGVWISTVRRGLWRWSEDGIRQSLPQQVIREPAVDLLEDRQRRLWLVTDNLGMLCLEGTNVTRYSTREGLPSHYIRRVVEDSTGQVWAADWEGALARFDTGHWTVVRPASGHRDAVRSMIACDGALWVGTSAGGLLRFKSGQTARIGVEHGLPDACIQQLLTDGRGWLWGCTPHKLFRVSLPQLNDVVAGRQDRVHAVTYGRSDGLPETSYAAWCDPRSWRTSEGELWFASANGAVHFNPQNLPADQPPRAVLEQALLDGTPVAAPALQNLRPGKGRLEFRYTAPCLTGPERVRFRYQLTGVDPDWVEAGLERSATYASIPAGRHTFRVVACSPEGVWGSEAATLALAGHPWFWQTAWFMAALTAALAGGGVWLARRATVRRLHLRLERLRHQHAIDRERARIAQDIHDELGANLTSIGLLADMGKRHKSDPVTVSRELSQISEAARESVTAMDAIVWALNPRNDSLDHFANYLAQFTREFFQPTALRTRLDLPANLPPLSMTTETRHQLLLLVKESFNNIVRHAQATEVQVALAYEPGRVRLSIADDGKGLNGAPVGEGRDGLTNLKERAQRLGGTLSIDSMDPGSRGTKLVFQLPLSKWTSSDVNQETDG